VIKLGLTGSIATGKSTVLQAFADLGVPVFSSDEAVHALYQGEAVPVVEALFPGVSHNGAIDRAELSRRLVGAPEKLKSLESAVHPLVRARMRKFIDKAQSTGAPLAVIDVPLLFETGFDYGLDRIAVTVVDETIQRDRALARPGMTVDKLGAILARQMPQAEKQKRADYVFDTAVPIEETRAQVADLVRALRSEGPTLN
jgi:dephospho-CoA kinase